ncbi:hypothetical protein B0H14DRAFT_2597636 [Mycena olivaceomarginata]|nr:hypothetical protein B0H14DRAFT_2597636 [Mycena olivaceomarginata]
MSTKLLQLILKEVFNIQAELEQCLMSTSSVPSSYNDNDSGSVSEMVPKPIDPWTTPTDISDDYERYLAGEYDNIELNFSDTSEVSDSGDITESDSSSIFDSATKFEAESLPGKFSFPSDVQVSEFVESSHYMQGIAVSDPMLHTLSYSFSYEDFDAVSQPDGASLEHANVQQLDAPKFDLLRGHFGVLFYSEKNSSELNAAFINNEQDAQVDYKSYLTQETAKLSSIPYSTHLSSCFTPSKNSLNPAIHLATTSAIWSSSTSPTSMQIFPAESPLYIHSTSETEPASITSMFIELILSQETSQAVNFEIIASANEHDSSSSTHPNFDEDLCTIIDFYTKQTEYPSQTESFKRAESQPFSLRTSYVHDFVLELLQSCIESHVHAQIEPTDDPQAIKSQDF